MHIPRLNTAILTTYLYLISTSPLHATTKINNPVIAPELGNSSTTPVNAIAIILARFFSAALGIGSVFFLVYLVINAFRWLTARGDSGAIAEARQGILDAIIGIIALSSIFAIANLIAPIIGLSSSQCTFPQQICWPTF